MSGDPVTVARVARAHGIHGALVLELETDHPEALFHEGRRLLIVGGPDGAPDEARVATASPHGRRWLVALEGVEDRTAAERLRGAGLAVPRAELPEFEEGGYLLGDLVGFALVEAGRELGEVREVYDLPAGPMLGVHIDGRERLVPFDEALVESVDVEGGRIHVALPEGLLDI